MPPVQMVGKGWASNHHWLIQSPLDLPSDEEQPGVARGRGEGSQLGGDLFCAGGLGSLWLLLLGPWLSFFYPEGK